MAQKNKIADAEVRKDLTDVWNAIASMKQSIDVLIKVAENIEANTADRTGFRRK